jgi:O-methyltransferase
MKKCIFMCIFNNENYVKLFYLLLESIYIYGNLDNNTDFLIYTSTLFMNMIKRNYLYSEKIKFELNDTYTTVNKACKSRLDIFNLPSIYKYKKILYLDVDILIKDEMEKIFNICTEDILYVLEEGTIDSIHDHWGKSLFGNEINNYKDKSAFSSGILLFNNCEKIKDLFNKIKEDTILRYKIFSCHDQPYFVYNAFKYNMFNNKILKDFAIDDSHGESDNKTIIHFSRDPGIYKYKLEKMTIYLNNMKEENFIIRKILLNKFTLVSEERLINLYIKCKLFKNTDYSFVECGVGKGGCVAIMKYACGKNNKIYGFDSFEGMPPITQKDIGKYNKSDPLSGFGKVGDNLSNGIGSVYDTFKSLNLSTINVSLIKGYFNDTLENQSNIDGVGDIAILRLDGDWYESVKICLDKLYDKVIEGGIIIIDDYGHFIGAKLATDEFREKNNIFSPLIKTDYTEHYWVKKTVHTINIEDDIWTCSKKMRYDIFNFFINNSHFKIAEIGSHKGYSTKILSQIFSKVYAVDNNIEWTNFNKNYNKDSNNIEYVMLDLYKDNWDVLPDDIEVSFIDAAHSYEGCKSDIINSINRFKNLQYIIFDDYGVWPGVKKIIDELIENKILIFKTFIGLTNVPGPHGIVENTNEGIICEIFKNKYKNILLDKIFSWENSEIKFLRDFKISGIKNGTYEHIDNFNIIATCDEKKYYIKFNDDYTAYSCTMNI